VPSKARSDPGTFVKKTIGTSDESGFSVRAVPIACVIDGREYIVNTFNGNQEDRDSYPPNPIGNTIVGFRVATPLTGTVKDVPARARFFSIFATKQSEDAAQSQPSPMLWAVTAVCP
jgi:hypothetical protein